MADETSNRCRDSLWALPASLILHGLLIAALVAHSQPRPGQQPEEEAVNVTLAPPPEQPKPEPAPPPPPKAPEAKKPEEPMQPPEAETEPSKPARIEVLKPVFRFADKDAGSGKSPEEGGVQTPSPATGDGSKPPAEERADATGDAEKQADVAKDAQPAHNAANEATATQSAGKQDKDRQEGLAEGADQQTSAAPPPPGAEGSDGELALPALAKVPEPRPAAAPKPSRSEVAKPGGGSRAPSPENADIAASQPYSGLPGVRRPQSQGGGALSTTAMAVVPRDKRAAQLCASALQQQLLQASYSPDLVPLVPLKRGNVLQVPEAAFRTRTAWHALSYRCEVDADATTILSLSFRVGATIPRDQWGRLGLPAND